MTRPGGLGAFIGVDEAALLREVDGAPDEAARVTALAAALERAVNPRRLPPAVRVAEVARLARSDRSLRRLDDLCARAEIGHRTLQRMFLRYAGVPPTWVLRRDRPDTSSLRTVTAALLTPQPEAQHGDRTSASQSLCVDVTTGGGQTQHSWPQLWP
ncbi:MAG: hypothetical protein ACYCYA_02640 [Actinomycetes bacterium]